MEKYVGIEEVHAESMTRGEYNKYRGWEIPQDENPLDEGYVVKRYNGHVNWIPKDVFDDIYSKPIDNDVEMVDLKHDLLTTKYTKVTHEKDFTNNAPHLFHVQSTYSKPEILGIIHFQEGPIKDVGVNGVNNEDLIAMVICRLEHFNQSDFRCRENSMAITKLEEALLWLRKRTMGREQRGVEGTNIE